MAKKRRASQTIPDYQMGGGRIPNWAGEPKSPEEPEGRRFTVGHQYYRDDLCRVKTMETTPLRKLLEKYRNTGLCAKELDLNSTGNLGIKVVHNSGAYEVYYRQLPSPDIAVKEFDVGDYRAFFFIDNLSKVIQMIAVDKHPQQ